MSTIKVTPEQLHHVSNQMDQARQQLEHIRGDLMRQIMFIQTMWMGATQERFYYEFEQSRPILDKALESMVSTSKELKDIATRFQDADAQLVSLGGATGAVGAAAIMTNSAGDSSSGDKGYRMAQINMFGKWVWMPVNEDGDADQAALQAYEKDHGHLDVNRMEGVKVEPPGDDIFTLQIKAFQNGIHPYTGETVSDSYARTMVTSLKFAQVFMAIQMVRGSFPGRSGPFRTSSSGLAAKIKNNMEAARAKNSNAQGNTQKSVVETSPKAVEQKVNLSQNLIDHVINRHSVNSTKQQLPYLQKKMSEEQINEMLSRKSFFNKEWSDKKITDASTVAVSQLKQQGVNEGLHTVTVFNEPIKVFIRNGNVDSIYGTHIYKISDLLD
ncbi:WXG100 family type VII secretion target [Paenibacillus sp. OK060]|uniref:WXG100 family type VII secretion target n=1 Tax=Paenibacillus sp. OK060 TaxID=1881034 RepID=UPI0008893AED|nr:WXG100 family type VII secretion target [Paenibacillus sp. OK060]SDL01928.1 WXG100 family type VII secretion target [Paenibacillus sp. OK060]